MATLEELVVEIKADSTNFKKDIGSVKSTMAGTKKSVDSLKGSIAKLAIGYGALIAVSRSLQSTIGTITTFEKLEASLRTVTGSLGGAQAAFKDMQDFAATTPFQLEEVVGAFIKLKALGLKPSEEALKSYGNTASAMGKSLNQVIEAVADASTFEFERLKEFGIRASQQGDQVVFTFQGVTTRIGKNSKEIQGYLQDIGSVNFGDAMEQQSDTLALAMSNAGDSFSRLQKAIGDAGFTELTKDVVGFFTEVTDVATQFFNSMDSRELIEVNSKLVDLMASRRELTEEINGGRDIWDTLLGTDPEQKLSNVNKSISELTARATELMEATSQAATPEGGSEDAFSILGINGDALEEELQLLQDSFLTREELEIEDSQKRLDRLKEFLSSEHTLTSDQRKLLEDLESGHATKIQNIKDKKQTQSDKDAAKEHATNAKEFRSILSQAASQNKILFNINKAAALAEAVLGAATSVQKAYDFGVKISGGNPVVGAVTAGIAAAATAANIAAIASSSFGGGGGGGASAPSVGSLPEIDGASAGGSSLATTPTQTVNINVDENALVTPAALIALINQGVEDGEQITINGAAV